MRRQVATPTRQLAAPSVPQIPIPASRQIDFMKQPLKPPYRYKEGSGLGPGFYLSDIKRMLHPDDFKQFLQEVAVVGEMDGESVVWALDYVRWVIREEER